MTRPELGVHQSGTRQERHLKAFGSPEVLAAVDDYVNRIADAAPPLTPWQRSQISVLLRTSAAESTTTTPTSFPAAA